MTVDARTPHYRPVTRTRGGVPRHLGHNERYPGRNRTSESTVARLADLVLHRREVRPGRKAFAQVATRRSLRSANTVLEFTPSTFAMSRACGSRSPGLASASAIARRIAAATCSCKGTGLSESILPGWYPSHCDHTLRMVHVNWDRRTPVPEAPEMVIGETMIRVRKLGVTVMVVLALMLAACTSSTSPPPTSSTSTAGASTTTITTAPVTRTTGVSPANLDRFVALARKGLRQPFEAVYRLVYSTAEIGQVNEFRIWSEPAAGTQNEGDFVYEATAGLLTFRFIHNRRGNYECLRASPQIKWRCIGPLVAASIGQTMMIEGYRLPMFLPRETMFLPQDTTTPMALSHRTVLSRRVWCLQTGPRFILCLTKTGQLAVATPTPLTSARQLELVSLAPIPSKLAFAPAARPTPWNGQGFPRLCGTTLCLPPGN